MSKKFNDEKDLKKGTKSRNYKRDNSKENDFGRGKYGKQRKCADNDPSWYAENEQLLKDAASLSFPYAVGTPFYTDDEASVFSNAYELSKGTPGIMALKYRSCPGVATSGVSPINIAAKNLYSYVRHANSGHANYDSPDLMLYFLAMDSVYSWYAELVRLYGVARTYSVRNKYMPVAYMEALGFNADDILSNMANLRYFINLTCVKINALAVPSNSSYLARHIWMNSHLFADAPGSRFQAYAYVPEGHYIYDETGSARGGYLKFTKKTDKMTYAQVVEYTNNLLQPIITSEDMGIMSGDILKAFGDNIVIVHPITEDYTIGPEYTEEVLMQIHNTRLIGNVVSEQNITQDPNNGDILYRPIVVNNKLDKIPLMFDMNKEFPEPGEIMVATRNMAVTEGDNTNNNHLLYAGSDFCTKAAIYYYFTQGGQNNLKSYEFTSDHVWSMNVQGTDIQTPTNWIPFVDRLSIFSILSHFDYHPFFNFELKVFNNDPQVDQLVETTLGITGDTCNATVINRETLRKLHETAIMSQFNVPGMGAFALSR